MFHLLKDDKHILSGEALSDAITMAKKYEIECFLLNCSPLERIEKALEIVSKNWNKEWGIYPNLGVGEPNPDGIIDTIYSDKDFINVFTPFVFYSGDHGLITNNEKSWID